MGESDLLIHNWSTSASAWQFGICEWHPSVIELSKNVTHGEKMKSPMQRTELLLGPASFKTDLSAYQVLGLGVFGTVLLVALVAFVSSRVKSGKTM